MKKKFLILWILSIAITCVLTYHGTSKASSGLQSKGKIIYNDASTGEEIVIDTNDHTLLKNNITANGSEIILLKEKDIELEQNIKDVNNRINMQDLQWYIDNGWLPPIPAEGEVPQNLEDCSWNMIQQLVASDTFKNYYSVGDTKSITLSTGEVVYMQVASINDGSGDAGVWYPKGTVDFISRDCLSTAYSLSSSGRYGDIGGWNGCSLRTQLNSGILNSLPTDVLNVIVEKTHEYYAAASGYVEATDKLWLPTVYEMRGSNTSHSNEKITSNQMYPIFSDGNYVKTYSGGGATNWWTSSDSTSAYASANYISNTGSMSVSASNTSMRVPLCFRIG